jgi:ribosomal protein S18 acetylase RimI-like enzyme
MSWRNMTTSDIKGLLHVADEVHPDLPESDDVFEERLRLFPGGCMVLVEDDEICGYAISHPIRHRQPPALGTKLGDIAADANQYYIHDLAILPKLRGRGLATECIDKLLAIASRYPTTSLVSVYGTSTFWGRFGFLSETIDEVLSKKLRNYGADAIFMSRHN